MCIWTGQFIIHQLYTGRNTRSWLQPAAIQKLPNSGSMSSKANSSKLNHMTCITFMIFEILINSAFQKCMVYVGQRVLILPFLTKMIEKYMISVKNAQLSRRDTYTPVIQFDPYSSLVEVIEMHKSETIWTFYINRNKAIMK